MLFGLFSFVSFVAWAIAPFNHQKIKDSFLFATCRSMTQYDNFINLKLITYRKQCMKYQLGITRESCFTTSTQNI